MIADIPDNARAMREEPFGPLALLSRVRNLDEAIEKANSVLGMVGLLGMALVAGSMNARYQDLEQRFEALDKDLTALAEVQEQATAELLAHAHQVVLTSLAVLFAVSAFCAAMA